MLKHIAVATVLTCGALGAYAQTTPPQPSPSTAPPAGTTGVTNVAPAAADAKRLIGRNIQNMQNETIGEIESVFIGADGKVDSVMVGVGGFLGMGEREVRLAWKDLQISDGGRKVVVNMTKDQLKAMPEYKYKDMAWRGQVFTDTGPYGERRSDAAPPMPTDRAADRAERRAERERAVTPPVPAPAPADRMATTSPPADRSAAPAERTVSTGDFNAHGDMSTYAVIGTKVKNQNNETVGSIEDIYMDKSGTVKTVVVSVGGFLGLGSKDVAVKWNDLDFGRDGNSIVIKTNWTKDSLKAMPDYKYERRQVASEPAPAGTPPARQQR
jgi:sporulation protein YlmC with PRC-barrel domain